MFIGYINMNILYVTTIGNTMDFFIDHFRMLLNEGHSVELACNTTISSPGKQCLALRLKVHSISFSRSPLDRGNFKAYSQLKQLVMTGNYNIVHCHTPNAAAITRFVCRNLRKKGMKVFYTAHGFHFYKDAPLKNWLLFYPVEWFLSYWTDTLITINQEDYAFARKHMHAKNVVYIPGVGIDINRFSRSSGNSAEKKKELGIPEDKIWVLAVGELSKRKNHEILLRALVDIPNIYCTIAGCGDLQVYLENLITELQLNDRVKLLGSRTDISRLCSSADIFALPSFQEGLSVALMEAMASGLPVVCSRIRGNIDLIDEKGGFFFDPHDIEETKKALINAIDSDWDLLGSYNRNKIKHYDISIVQHEMAKIYGGGYNHLISLINRYQLRRGMGLDRDAVMLLSVGELNINKNHQIVIRALARLQDDNIHYVIAGTGGQSENLMQLAKELGVWEHVHLLGYRTDMDELYRAADVYVLPSFHEELNVSVMEAMAAGLPCIVSNIRGNTDLIDSKGGILFDQYNIDDVQNVLKEIIYKSNIDKLMLGRYNKRKILHFDYKNTTKEYTALYLVKLFKKYNIRKSIGLSMDKFILMSVGELNKNKNHEIILRAIAEIGDFNIHYVIAGTGNMKQYLTALAKKIGIANQLHLLGFRDDIPDLYNASDICCFPSIREGLGMAALEGMACGLPLIAADNRGVRSFCIHGENGFICESDNIRQFKDAIVYLKNHSEVRKKMGLKNIEAVKQWRTDIVVQKINEIYINI